MKQDLIMLVGFTDGQAPAPAGECAGWEQAYPILAVNVSITALGSTIAGVDSPGVSMAVAVPPDPGGGRVGRFPPRPVRG